MDKREFNDPFINADDENHPKVLMKKMVQAFYDTHTTNTFSETSELEFRFGTIGHKPLKRTDYENVIINMSDLVNSLMLQTVLSTDSTNPQQSLAQLVQLNNAKAALNNVMIFIDGK